MKNFNIEPILLTLSGNTLITTFSGTDCLEPVTDEKTIIKTGYIGRHDKCGGFMHVKVFSSICIALYCSNCNFRIEIPAGVTTYGRLRQHCKEEMAREVREKRAIAAMVNNFLEEESTKGLSILERHLRKQ